MVRFVLVDPRHVLPSNGNAQPTMSNGGRSTCTLAIFDNTSHHPLQWKHLHYIQWDLSPRHLNRNCYKRDDKTQRESWNETNGNCHAHINATIILTKCMCYIPDMEYIKLGFPVDKYCRSIGC